MSAFAKLHAIEVFCLTYELGNFTKAAKALGVTPQAVSRAVAKLERELGVALFRRHTRALHPTPASHSYYQACSQALEQLERAQDALKSADDTPSGLVRISAPTTYGHHRLLPSLPALSQRYPQITLEVEISNHNVDFVKQGFDLAIRMGQPPDGPLVARKLGDFTLGLFASPDYVARRGAPTSFEALAEHDCAVFVMPSTGKTLAWSFPPHASSPERWTPEAKTRICDDVLGLITFARAGGGIIQLYHYLVEQELASGSLIELLPQHSGASRPFYLLYPKREAARPERAATRAIIEHILTLAERDLLKGSRP